MVGTNSGLHLPELSHFEKIRGLREHTRPCEFDVIVRHCGGSRVRSHSSELLEFLELAFVHVILPNLFLLCLCGKRIFHYFLYWSRRAVRSAKSLNQRHMSFCGRVSNCGSS
jgi:hypothetical protein